MEGEFQDQGQIDQDLEEWLSPRGSQSVHCFFSEEEKQQSIQMEDSAPEGEIIGNQAPEVEISTMVVVRWPDKVEGPGDNIYSPLCGGLYKEYEDSLVPWSGTYPDSNMNCFTCPKYKDDQIVPEDQYDEELKKWRGPIHNGQLYSQTLKDKIYTEKTCSKYAGSVKFNSIPKEVNQVIHIKFYKDQFCEHMIRNGMWDVFSLPTHAIKRRGGIFFYISLYFPWNM